MDARSIARIGALAGFFAVVAIFTYHLGLQALVGQRVSGTTDAALINAYYGHGVVAIAGIFAAIAWLVPIMVFAVALRETLAGTLRGRFLSTIALVAVVAEIPALLTVIAAQAALVAGVAAGSDVVPLFRFWDVLFNSGLEVIEATWIIGFGLAMAGMAGFPRWMPAFSVVTGVLKALTVFAIWIGLPDAVTLPPNLLFGVWFVGASIGLLRLSREPRATAAVARALGGAG